MKLRLHRWKRTDAGARCKACAVIWRWLDTREQPHLRRALWVWPDETNRIEQPRADGGRHWKCGEMPRREGAT